MFAAMTTQAAAGTSQPGAAGGPARRRGVGARDARGDLARDGADLPLETADARLARVLRDRATDGVVLDRDRIGREAVLLELTRDEIAARDVYLLVLRVTGERDDLHAIEQRRMDRAELVRRGDEEYARQVDVDLEIVIA